MLILQELGHTPHGLHNKCAYKAWGIGKPEPYPWKNGKLTFCVVFRLTLLNHQVHKLSAKPVREPSFPWVSWGAMGEKDGVKAQESVRENRNENRKRKATRGTDRGKKPGVEPWTCPDSNTSHEKRPYWWHKVKCFLHTSTGTDTYADTSLQPESPMYET